MSDLAVVILAAGQGKRMLSKLPKVLHRLCGRPMLDYVLDAAWSLNPGQVVGVVDFEGPVADSFRNRGARVAFQPVRRGTGDAARIGLSEVQGKPDRLLVLNGDVPLLRPGTLRKMLDLLEESADLVLLAAQVLNPHGYGRIFQRDGAVRIVEQVDATPEERRHCLINVGVYGGRASFFSDALPRLQSDNLQGEFYLTDLAPMAGPGRCRVVELQDVHEAAGVNNRAQLAQVEALLRQRKNREIMLSGVTMRDPERTYLDWAVEVAPESLLYPNVILEGRTRIGAGCTIYPGVRIVDSQIGEDSVILDGTVVENSVVGPRSKVGPMAHLRPGTRLGARCKIGNFVETKAVTVGEGSKASHLSYLGDAVIGRDVNIGCGTITCNYDGVSKHVTIIEDGVFVGSDTQLVAPVTVGRGAIVASGSTITSDVPPEALVLTRAPTVVKEDYASRYWEGRQRRPSGDGATLEKRSSTSLVDTRDPEIG